jgi:hypothetical protein
VLPSTGKTIGSQSHTQDALTDVVVASVQKRDINGKKYVLHDIYITSLN